MNKPQPPSNKAELLSNLLKIVRHGKYEMPEDRYNGTGGPGIFLEDLLGLNSQNKDIPDSLGYELKYYTEKTNLITLFHKEPSPIGVVSYMVQKYGWLDQHGRKSFRHTISGRSDRFKIESDANQIIVRRIGGNGLVPYWTHDELLNAMAYKLRRLILVKGNKSGQTVVYERADLFEELEMSLFILEICTGTINIDFDARENVKGKTTLRNHGTKFRISPKNICRIYSKKERIV